MLSLFFKSHTEFLKTLEGHEYKVQQFLRPLMSFLEDGRRTSIVNNVYYRQCHMFLEIGNGIGLLVMRPLKLQVRHLQQNET